MKQFDPIHFTPRPGKHINRRFFKGGGGDTSSTQTVQNFSPEEAANRAKVQNEASRIYNQTAGTISSSPYPGAQVVPLSQDSLTAQNLAKAGANTIAGQYIPMLNQATQFGLSDVLNVNSNPYLQSTIAAGIRPITESYTDAGGVLSNIRNESITNGGQGQSTRQGIAEGIAAGRYADAISDVSSKIATEGYGKGLDTFSRIYGLAPGAAELMQTPAAIYGSIGSQNESVGQAQENYRADARNWNLNSQWLPLQNWSNIVYGGTGPTGTTSTSSGGGTKSNPIMGAAGGALAGYQLGTMGGATFGPAGAIGGAILGGLFS